MSAERLRQLEQGDNLIYVYTRLFDFSEKLKAEEVERIVLEAVGESFVQQGIQLPDKILTFVPFRDTRQDQITLPDKTRVIYEEDLKRLNRCVMLVGFLDGLSKDEGVCLEIGYAYGKGIPIVALFTDFIQREFKGFPESAHIADPVLLAMITKVVRNYRIVEAEKPFAERLRLSQNTALEDLKEAVYETLIESSTEKRLDAGEKYDVYIDIGGGQFEWERRIQQELSTELIGMGYSVEISRRNFDLNTLNDDSVSARQRIIDFGKRDIEAALSARVIITCADMEEMSSGTAAIQGLALAFGKNVILLDTRTNDLVGDGGHRMSRNLMIDYSADIVARSQKDISGLVSKYLGK